MNDLQLMEEFMQTATVDGTVVVLIKVISWDGPSTPLTHWTEGCVLSKNPTESEIQDAKRRLLDDNRFFRTCPECEIRKPIGWMMELYCQSCGEKNHGIAF